MLRETTILLLGASIAVAFPSGLPFCTLRPQVQTTWAEQIGTTKISFNQTCYKPGDEILVRFSAADGNSFHGFVMRADSGQFVRRHGFGGYRWLGSEETPDQSCITHVFPGHREENGKFDKTSVEAKLLVPNQGGATPTRIILEATAIKSFDDKPWEVEWQSGIYSIARASINICPRRRFTQERPRPRIAALKRSRTQPSSQRSSKPQAALKRGQIQFNPHNRCKQASDPGRCPNAPRGVVDWVQPYYYDQGAKVCRKFFYAGCGGNNNRFQSRSECERWCTGGSEPCAKKQNPKCPEGTNTTWRAAYFLSEATAQCLHYWYRSCADDDLPQFDNETGCRAQCLGIVEEEEEELSFGSKGRCFELYDEDKKMCPIWATKKICSPYPEQHKNHWAHFNCRLSCCQKWSL